MHTLGSKSKTTFLVTQTEKLSVEFTASAVIKKGQPVMLAADGTVVVWTKASLLHTLVGYAYSDAAIGDGVTVITRGCAIIFGISTGVLNAGPVAYQSYDAATDIGGATGYGEWANSATAAENNGWALDAAAADNALIRVLVMG